MGSKGGGGSAPAAPDPTATAAAQGLANIQAAQETAKLSRINQRTPYGDLVYNKVSDYGEQPKKIGSTWYVGDTAFGDTPEAAQRYVDNQAQYEAVTTLNPEQQRMLDLTNQAGIKYGETANRQLTDVSNRLASPLDFGSLGAMPVMNEETRLNAANAAMARVQPRFDQDRQRMETQLANKGFAVGSNAYDRGMDELNRSITDARFAADAQGSNQMQNIYNQQMNQRNQNINEMIQQRQIPLNELAAMLSGSQVTSPTFQNISSPTVAAPDIMGATYNSYSGNLDAYNQQQANQQSGNDAMMGGLFGLGSAGLSAFMAPEAVALAPLMMSDRRLKTNIEKIGEMKNGLNLYTFDYKEGHGLQKGKQIGFMADEVKKVHPDAVHRVGEYDMVDYSKAGL